MIEIMKSDTRVSRALNMQWKHTYQMFYDMSLKKMRKITDLAVKSFFNMDYFKLANTRVEHLPGRVEMELF